MTDKITHPSDSSKQREIEQLIVNQIAKKESLKFETKKSITIKDVVFEFDFYNAEKKIIGEIYAGIDKISAGSRKKVITDCFKMVYAEKLIDSPCIKRLIFVDKNIEKVFTGKSWAAKAIEAYNIKTKVIEISEEDMTILSKTKELQQRSNQKKTILIKPSFNHQ